jgi:hypothetical protein
LAIIKIDAAMRAGRLRLDGNPVLEWCLGNVVGKADRRGNLYPTKQRPDQKIDAAVALMMAIGWAMSEDDPILVSYWSRWISVEPAVDMMMVEALPPRCRPVTVRVGDSALLTLVGRDRWCSFLCPLLVRPYLADPFEDFNGDPLLGQGGQSWAASSGGGG